MADLVERFYPELVSAALLLGAILAGLLAHAVLYFVAVRASRRLGGRIDDSIVRHSRVPMRLILPLAVVQAALPWLALPEQAIGLVRHLAALVQIGAVSWLVVGMARVLEDYLAGRYPIDVKENLEARRVHTQLRVLRRVVVLLVSLIALSAMLMTFPRIRQLGATLLASAGVIGLVAGIAARPVLANLIAGLQIALAQPIRLDDVVIVEGEWGRIEEITATYVVVRIWDERRLIVPLARFLETPFQNWTRKSAELLGTVTLHADYTVPVEEVRAELHRILAASDEWDGRVWNLQVTNATERTVEVRALMSAADSSAAWNLRCRVRERLLAWLQERHPDALPRVRADLRRLRADGVAPEVAARP